MLAVPSASARTSLPGAAINRSSHGWRCGTAAVTASILLVHVTAHWSAEVGSSPVAPKQVQVAVAHRPQPERSQRTDQFTHLDEMIGHISYSNMKHFANRGLTAPIEVNREA